MSSAAIALLLTLAPLGTSRSSAQSATADPGRLAKGRFLVAGRNLRDPNFARTVVLLLEHGPQGAMGLIVNRPTEIELKDLLTETEGLGERADTVFAGGPVLRDHMLMLVRSESAPEESQQVMEEVYYSASRDLLSRLLGRGEDSTTVRAYAGHAGWAPGQLEWEVKQGGWHILTAEAASVFTADPLELWDELIRRSSGQWT